MSYVLFGAGTIGRLIARQLTAKGTPPLVFADNDPAKQKTKIEGVDVVNPRAAVLAYPKAQWIATVHRLPARTQILRELDKLGVAQVPLSNFVPMHCDVPPLSAQLTIRPLAADRETLEEFIDQIEFRKRFSAHAQRPPRDIANVYFEDFFTHLPTEHFVDCGAADGDTVEEFRKRWEEYSAITAFEPDPENFAKLQAKNIAECWSCAIGDHNGSVSFVSTGDQTAHIARDSSGLTLKTSLWTLDSWKFGVPPTFIKMDIEGVELEALWGAREIIRKHSPVLAICAYHTGPHLWQIPLLLHALHPDYRLFLRRYLDATWELVWYAVPPERLK